MSARCLVGPLLAALLLAAGGVLGAQSLVAVDSSRQLYRVDRATGTKIQFGSVTTNAVTPSGLAYDLISGTLYLSTTGGNELFRLDVNTGTATLIGSYGLTSLMHGIAFDLSRNTLFVCSSAPSTGNNNLHTVDVNTGLATAVGSTGLSSFVNIAYDILGDVLYAAHSGDDSLYVLDRTTGAATLVGPLNGPSNPTDLAYDLTTDTLWLVDNRTQGLYRVDRATGAATLVGQFGPGNLLGLEALPPSGSYDIFGSGCPGSLGVPGNVLVAGPNVGSSWTVHLTRLPFDAAVFAYGLSNTTSSLFGSLPFDLAPVGAPGCLARIDVLGSTFVVGAGGTATFSVAVPDAPATLVGRTLHTQGLVFDTVNPFGFTVSDAATAVVGL